MRGAIVDDIIRVLPKERTLFYYFPDRYAVLLLSFFIEAGKEIRAIKKSNFFRLLARPPVADIVSGKGGGLLTPDDLAFAWPAESECYRLTLGKWGKDKPTKWYRDYYQTTRTGVNLVLQLNFSSKHNSAYRRLIKGGGDRPFVSEEHPVAKGNLHTLAWARMDFDLDRGEALIEEVQTDWLRFVFTGKRILEDLLRYESVRSGFFRGAEIDLDQLENYIDHVLNLHMRMWDEAILSAAIWFLVEEIGLKTIYYHDYDCGLKLKKITGGRPPRSLYTDLPKRFCFQKTAEIPAFLNDKPQRTLKTLIKEGKLSFWRLDLP